MQPPKGVPQSIADALRGTYNAHVLSKVGDYAGMFRWGNSTLVSTTDGVGTKVVLACEESAETGNDEWHRGIGMDLVAHCVNDLLAAHAVPLFFLNCFSYGDARAERFQKHVIDGMCEIAREIEVPVISGETAKMEGFFPYPHHAYDVTGTMIGLLWEDIKINGKCVKPGHKLVGLKSSGLHTNGYTLLREVFSRPENVKMWRDCPELGCGVRQEALVPHRSYYRLGRDLMLKDLTDAMAHVTGGGIETNLKRVIGDNNFRINWGSWDWPKLFQIIQRCGVSYDEMRRTYNLGIGMVLVVRPDKIDGLFKTLEQHGETWVELGEVV